jgi:hypothetical protein
MAPRLIHWGVRAESPKVFVSAAPLGHWASVPGGPRGLGAQPPGGGLTA